MLITYKNIDKVRFPVFRLLDGDLEEADGILFYKGKVLDDKNMSGGTLGARRLQTPFKNIFRLRSMIDSHLGLIKQTSRYFIDSNGIPFIYRKTLFCALHYYKIEKVELKTTASLLWLKGVTHPFTIPRPPSSDRPWAGVLHLYNIPWLLYEYSETKKESSRRKV